MPTLTVTQKTIDRAYELLSGDAITYRLSTYCPMGLQMCKYLGLEEGEYNWRFHEGDSHGEKLYKSSQAAALVVDPFDSTKLLTGPITVDIEEVT